MISIRRNHRSSPSPFFGVRSYLLFFVALILLMAWVWVRVETGEKSLWLLLASGAVAFFAFGMSVYGIIKQFRNGKNT